MPDTIIIHKGYSNGTLKLSQEHITVDRFTRINWIIHDTANVASIVGIHKKKGSPVLFIGAPRRDGNSWTGKVIFAPERDYEYYIEWTEKGTGTRRTHDPKISVNPDLWFVLFVVILLIFIGVPTVLYARRTRNRRRL